MLQNTPAPIILNPNPTSLCDDCALLFLYDITQHNKYAKQTQ